MMQILIVKLGSIGDIVHTLPALAAIRKALPQAEISWVVEHRAAEILRDNPLLDRLIEVDTKALRRGLMSGETLRAPRHRVFGFSRDSLREPASRILISRSIPISKNSHVIRKNLTLAGGALGISISDDPADFEFPIATNSAHQAEALNAADGTDFAILNPGGGWPTKLWSAGRFGRLADELWSHYGLHSLVTHGPGEVQLAETVLQASQSGKARAVNVSLKGFYELAKSAQVYVGGDTGPTHLAIAAGAPIVGLFGPTEWWRNGSLRPADICVERVDIDCRTDCHRRACSKWICMDIEVERVFQAVAQRLKTGQASLPVVV